MTKTKTVPAARLSMPGAAEDWHTVDGLPGHFHPSIAVPLDQPGMPSKALLDAFLSAHTERVKDATSGWEALRAEKLDGDLGDIGAFATPPTPVEIVQLPEAKVEQHAQLARDQRARSSRALVKARRAGQASEPNVKAEADALTGAGEEN